jgi:hypothetical protein
METSIENSVKIGKLNGLNIKNLKERRRNGI